LQIIMTPSEDDLRIVMTLSQKYEEPSTKELIMERKKLSPEDVLHLALGSNKESVSSEEVIQLNKQTETLAKNWNSLEKR